jgi:hypothetical protein
MAMANNFPDMPMCQLMSLQYGIEVTQVNGRNNNTVPGTMNMMFFGFVAGQDENGAYIFDYDQDGTFDQDAHEAQMAGLLDGLCAMWAQVLGQDVPTVQDHIKVKRTWAMTTPTVMAQGSWPMFEISDYMPYPAL